MGVKQRQTGRWQVDLHSTYVGVYSDERTARMVHASGTRQLELGKPLQAVVRELRGRSATPTLHEYAAEWLPTCTTSDHAEALYRHRLAWERMEPHIGKRTVEALGTEDVKRLVATLSERFGAKTVRSTIATLKMMLEDARDAGLVDRNVAARVRNLPALPTSKRRAMTPSEFRAAVERTSERHRPIVAVAGLSGMRMGELLAIKWSDISEDGIRVERQVDAAGEKPTKKDRRGRSKIRTVPLTTEAREWLEEQRRLTPRPDSEYVFCGVEGRPLSRTTARRIFAEAGEFVPHEYRHTFGSWCLSSNIPPHIVAEWMGHSPEMLMRVYAHEIMSDRASMVGRLEQHLDGDHMGTD